MTRPKSIPGIRLKRRTAEIEGAPFITFELWLDDEPVALLGALAMAFVDDPGDELLEDWSKAVG